MITNLRQPSPPTPTPTPPPPLPDYYGQFREGRLNNVQNSLSQRNPTLPEGEDELRGPPNKKTKPRRGRCYMLDIEPGAEAALERSKMGIGPEVVLIKANSNRKLECRICEGEHALSRCPVIVSTNISFDALRKMSVEARREYLKSLGLGQYFPDHSTRGSAVEHNDNATMKAKDVVDNRKTKARGIEDMSAQCSSRVCAVENKLCLICERSDHPTGACPYMLCIPRGIKVSSNAEIFCECCNKVGAPHEDEERVKYYADLKFCGYCFAMGSHSAKSSDDCPDKEGQERLNKVHDETLKKLKKRAEEWRRRNPEAARINMI